MALLSASEEKSSIMQSNGTHVSLICMYDGAAVRYRANYGLGDTKLG